ncbi:helix-turn-helix domain-containing protein [Mycobacterium sp. P7213]|uniref:helix-turn-helix domain-containing protein n=1 Tax=Mycobacterium sp. P7213 TaxID=2478465 RepID=UPI000F63B0CC|nr:helix-turn-helix domain-containing protein [Mycobacterium sp. P7213]
MLPNRPSVPAIPEAGLLELAGLGLSRERRVAAKAARKACNLPIGRTRALSPDQIALAERMRAAGEPVAEIAKTLDVSRPTMYRLLGIRGPSA